MSVLHGRVVKVQVDSLDLSGFDVAFSVSKSLKSEPNTAEIRLFNLGESTRGKLARKGGVFVSLLAGYAGAMTQLYYGDLRDVYSQQDGSDWVTTISSGDGEQARANARLRRTFPKGTNVSQVVQALAQSLGVGVGNSLTAMLGAKPIGGSPTTFSGLAVSGHASDNMDRVMRSLGKEWSIQDGKIQVIDIGHPVPGKAVLLTEETGLIGSPEAGPKKSGKTPLAMKCRALIQPGLQPGGTVAITSRSVTGLYRIDKVDFSGSTAGSDWFADLECSEVKL